MSAPTPLLTCRDLVVTYDGVHRALDRVSFSVRRGSVLALLGPNGAGKSTCLRVMATLQQPARGEVTFDGAPAWPRRHSVRPRIGFLGDGTAMYPRMLARTYLVFFAECYGASRRDAEARAEELLDQFGLADKAEAEIASLSKGMRQRLSIARTMVQRPDLLLLDEPADGLDPMGRRELRQLLRTIADDGVAVVVSSHILRELDGLCDRVVVLERGRVAVEGSVQEIIEGYEVNRRVYEIDVTGGLQTVLQALAARDCMVERVEALPDEGEPPGLEEMQHADAGRVLARVRGEATEAATLLSSLVASGAQISGFQKVRTDLEDVYQSLGRDGLG